MKLEKKYLLLLLFYAALSCVWISADGHFLFLMSIDGARSIFSIYQDWSQHNLVNDRSYNPFFYGWGPLESWLLLLSHFIFKTLNYDLNQSLSPYGVFLFKAILRLPAVLITIFLLKEIFNKRAAFYFALNPLIIYFIIVSGLNDIYLNIFYLLIIYFVINKKINSAIVFIAISLLFKSQTILFTLPIILLSINTFSKREVIKLIFIPYLVYFLITRPYKWFSGDYSFYINLNFTDLMRIKYWLGQGFAGELLPISYSIIILLFCTLYILENKIKLNLANITIFSIPFVTIIHLTSFDSTLRWDLVLVTIFSIIYSSKNLSNFIRMLLWIYPLIIVIGHIVLKEDISGYTSNSGLNLLGWSGAINYSFQNPQSLSQIPFMIVKPYLIDLFPGTMSTKQIFQFILIILLSTRISLIVFLYYFLIANSKFLFDGVEYKNNLQMISIKHTILNFVLYVFIIFCIYLILFSIYAGR